MDNSNYYKVFIAGFLGALFCIVGFYSIAVYRVNKDPDRIEYYALSDSLEIKHMEICEVNDQRMRILNSDSIDWDYYQDRQNVYDSISNIQDSLRTRFNELYYKLTE